MDKLYGHKEEFQVPYYFFYWVAKFIGAGFAIGCAFALYNIIVIIFVDWGKTDRFSIAFQAKTKLTPLLNKHLRRLPGS